MIPTVFRFATSTMQTLLSGAAQATKSFAPFGESAKPDGEPGMAMDAVTFCCDVLKHKTRLAVAQATYIVLPSENAAKAAGDKGTVWAIATLRVANSRMAGNERIARKILSRT